MTRENWAKHVRRWRESGLHAAEYGQREGLNASTLRWWSSRLRSERAAPAFIEVALNESTSEAYIEVAIGEHVRVHVRRGFDAELLRQVVAALEGR